MSLTIEGSGDIQLASEGTHLARCVQLIDLGHQSVEWEGKRKWSPKILIGWELYEDSGPVMAWRRYTKSLSKNANLRRDLVSWRGRQFTAEELARFDMSTILDKPCMVTVVHNKTPDATYANIEAVSAIPRGLALPDRVAPLVRFDVDDFDQTLFESFGERLRDTIKKSRELSGSQATSGGSDFFGPNDGPIIEPEDDSGIPF